MSQDGSSSKSYIKHPTEKSRLDNLAFTSFPEDYLPYTSPSYQKKAPYLVWDHHHYDGGGGLFRAKRRRLRRCCCGTAALASAIALLVAAILAIVAVSVYLGVVTNLFRSPIFSLSGKFRVVNGDNFEEILLNQTSYEFLTKAEYYKVLIENAISSSSLAPALVATRVFAFRPGSVLVFFRLHLDRRKLADDDQEALRVAKQLLVEQAIVAPSPTFDNLILDLPSIDIREYDAESWLMDPDFYLDPEETVDLHQSTTEERSAVHTTTDSPAQNTVSLETTTTQASTSSNLNEVTHEQSKSDKLPVHSTTEKIRVTPPPRFSAATRGHGVVGYGYAEWKPIDLPEAIKVSSLGAITPATKSERVPPRTGSASVIQDRKPQVSVVTRNGANAGSAHKPQQPNVASSITSSVSLFIRPSSKNRTREATSGVVREIALSDDKDVPLNDGVFVDGSSEVGNRKNSASFRFLELPEDQSNDAVNHTADHEVEGETGKAEVFEELFNDGLEHSGLTTLEPFSADRPDSEAPFDEFSTASNDEDPSSAELYSGVSEVFSTEYTEFESMPVDSHPHSSSIRENGTDHVNSSKWIDDEIEVTPEQFPENSTDGHLLALNSTVVEDRDEDNETYDQITTPFAVLMSTFRFSEDESTLEEKLSESTRTGNVNSSDVEDAVLTTLLQEHDVPAKPNVSLELEEATILNHYHYPTQETTYQTLDSQKQNHSSQDELATTLIEATDVPVTTPSADLSNTSTILHQDLRFRKIVQPFKDDSFNPNDINSKDNLKGDDIFLRVGHTSTIRIPLPLPMDPTFDGKIDDNIIRHVTTHLPTTMKVDDSSSESFEPVLRCLESEVTCGSGECIPLDYLCNMRRDCDDNSDEERCTCADYLRVLGQPQKLCDGIRDCWDDSDEENCPWCSPGQFPCLPSKVCINASQVCDGSNDCPLGTDERYCVKLAENEARAKSLDYFPEGYLMVRKGGSWGKLCLGSHLVPEGSLQNKLNEIGRAVCSTLTYRVFHEAIQVHDEAEISKNFYYEIKGHPDQEKQHSSAIFEPTACPNKGVVRVKCQSLECGLRPMAVSSRRRIVGGQSTGSGSWPWQAALYKEGDFQCGAVLVSDTWLISAGHCFYSTQSNHWTARLGILRRGTELRSPSEQVRRIAQILLHPEYVDKGFINDIALLRMEKPVPFSDYLRPLCLPTAIEDVRLWNGQHCSVVGWGKLFEVGHTFPDSLQEVRLPVISTEECRKRIIFLSMYHITDNMFCAGYEQGGHDACLGDSGGPLMCQRQDGRWVLLGVTSNGDGCGRPGRPGVYTKVTQYLDWIEQIMSDTTWLDNKTSTCLGHRCELGRCVQQYKVCDKRFDCPDGSDEQNCPLSTKL